ncbi:MAG: hypothetical protein HDT47_02930 [Ruminococcaceae bacterium]|nr:hypothetical protein [Oscillospiraceae bacterium]
MAITTNVSGTLKDFYEVYSDVSGTLKELKEVYSNVNGTLKQIHSALPSPIEGTVAASDTGIILAKDIVIPTFCTVSAVLVVSGMCLAGSSMTLNAICNDVTTEVCSANVKTGISYSGSISLPAGTYSFKLKGPRQIANTEVSYAITFSIITM